MKTILTVLLLSVLNTSFAQNYTPKDYGHIFNDISKDGITKEQLFTTMNRDLMRMDDSICANRALMWLWDIKDKFNVDAGKIFVFYTQKHGAVGRTDWWYHVAPVVNENSKLWVMEGAYPEIFKEPITIDKWFKSFIGSTNCKEIEAHDRDLLKLMYKGRRFPSETAHGKYDCYYKIVPSGYWFPSSVAMNLLGEDENGEPVIFERDHMNAREVYSACLEAANSTVGTFLRFNKRKCKKFAGLL